MTKGKNPYSGHPTGGHAGESYKGGSKPKHLKHIPDHMLASHGGEPRMSMTTRDFDRDLGCHQQEDSGD